jgi:hypothetical protein
MERGIFLINNIETSQTIQNYIDDTIIQNRNKCMACFKLFFDFDVESTVCYKKDQKEFKDEFLKYIYTLAISYIRCSGIDDTYLSLNFIECITSEEPFMLKNSKYANVIFHFNGNYGYVTTHIDKINYLVDDNKYIVVTFDKVKK